MRALANIWVVGLACACVSTELSSPADGPAHANATSGSEPARSQVLEPGYDPFEHVAAPAQAPGAHDHGAPAPGAHDHGAHSGTPAAASNGAHDHGAHSGTPAAASDGGAPAASSFTCPMHPEIVRDAPGKCPICGMKLVPRKDPKP